MASVRHQRLVQCLADQADATAQRHADSPREYSFSQMALAIGICSGAARRSGWKSFRSSPSRSGETSSNASYTAPTVTSLLHRSHAIYVYQTLHKSCCTDYIMRCERLGLEERKRMNIGDAEDHHPSGGNILEDFGNAPTGSSPIFEC